MTERDQTATKVHELIEPFNKKGVAVGETVAVTLANRSALSVRGGTGSSADMESIAGRRSLFGIGFNVTVGTMGAYRTTETSMTVAANTIRMKLVILTNSIPSRLCPCDCYSI